ncbi:serine hydrolase [Caulobacter sp. 17J80-11]|uniref:serine hydrolase domain-containing protein n=1 Tax=Caulobacter sp. 17J80-11 TaxID=2763502 RepID=UPI0016537B5D|nr:serine hydrolase domain-containing protein [Caulobacter sp. 17J80-11]MBC6982278.1 beta-lactamase family protein [Caulobacter sp. 17J80-11]
MRIDRRGLIAGAAGLAAMARPLDALAARKPREDRPAGIDAYLDRLQTFGFSGALFAVENGRTAFHRELGWADKGLGVRFSRYTPFNIASITKTFTAAAVMRLVEEGVVALDDPLRRFFPDAPEDKAAITLAQLLSHSSGLERQVLRGKEPLTREDATAQILGSKLGAAPGERFTYSNEGFRLLAAVVEVASKRSFRTVVDEEIFTPAGMANSGFAQDYRTRATIARGCNEWKALASFREEQNPGWYEGAGNIVSTAVDLERYVTALEAGAIVRPDSLAQMFAPHSPPTGMGGVEGYGYGWYSAKPETSPPFVFHGGDNPGYHSELRWYPSTRRWAFVIATREAYDDSGAGVATYKSGIVRDVVRYREDVPVDAPPEVTAVRRDVERRLAGRWVAGDGVIEFKRLDPSDQHLTVIATGQPAADALVGGDPELEKRLAAANARTLRLAEAIAREDAEALKPLLGDLGFFIKGWLADFAAWRQASGAFQGLGRPTSRPTPFGTDQIRTHLTFRFEKAAVVLEFTWNGEELYETISETGAPSSVVLPMATAGDQTLVTYDFVTRRIVGVRIDSRDSIVVGSTRFQLQA